MLDDTAVTKDLQQMRRYVLWSIVPVPLVFALVNMVQTVNLYGTGALGLTLLTCVLLTSWSTFVLCYWSVDGTADGRRVGPGWLGRRDWVLFAIGIAGATLAVVLELLAPNGPRTEVEGQRLGDVVAAPWQSGWPMLIALLIASLVLNTPDGKRRWAVLIAVLASLPVVLPAALFLNGVWLLLPLAIPFMTMVLWSFWWIYGITRRLDAARRVAAELAVAEERLRFAAELHDIQGHHLQVIALKSELAARLAEADPATARGEMREVERLAREALTDTRAVVGGYRDVRLRTELANAVRVLGAAGINARHGLNGERIELSDPAAERLLGLAVREATTNMIRHASPTRARLDLDTAGDRIRLVVRNDGADRSSSTGDGDPREGGLAALRERFVEAGGELDWERTREEFVVRAEVVDRSGKDESAAEQTTRSSATTDSERRGDERVRETSSEGAG